MRTKNKIPQWKGETVLCMAVQVVQKVQQGIDCLLNDLDARLSHNRCERTHRTHNVKALLKTYFRNDYLSHDKKSLVSIVIDVTGRTQVRGFTNVPWISCDVWSYKNEVKTRGEDDSNDAEGGGVWTPHYETSPKYVDYSVSKNKSPAILWRVRSYALRLLEVNRDRIAKLIIKPVVGMVNDPKGFDLGAALTGKCFADALVACKGKELYDWFEV